MNGTENPKIILVEDSATDALLTKRALQLNQIVANIVWLKDGAEALDYLFHEGAYAQQAETAHPRFIILDLKLPRVDGIEVLARLKADDHLREIPVVMLSSSAEDRDLHAAYRLGVNSYVVKPMDFGDFSKVVAEIGSYWLRINRPNSA